MRFLIVSKNKYQMPPGIGPALLDAQMAWARKYTQNGKMEQVWSFAGLQAGGGILNVDSLDELDAIVQEFPLGPFGEQEIYALVDHIECMQRMKQVMQAMGPPPGR